MTYSRKPVTRRKLSKNRSLHRLPPKVSQHQTSPLLSGRNVLRSSLITSPEASIKPPHSSSSLRPSLLSRMTANPSVQLSLPIVECSTALIDIAMQHDQGGSNRIHPHLTK